MAHFAKVDPSGVVVNVIVAEPEFFETFIDSSPGSWIQTSFNTRGGVYYTPGSNHQVVDPDQSKALRKNSAAIGGTYDAVRDAFIPPKPSNFPSWVLDEQTCLWKTPVDKPTEELPENKRYVWNESTTSWDVIDYTGSTLTNANE